MDSWLPIGNEHAVDIMAVRVIFSDPLTDLSYRNYVKTVEDCCFASGLRSRHFAASPVVTFGPNGPIAGGEHSHSRIYNSVSSNEPNPTVAAKVVEQVQIDQVGAIFRTWIYGGWALQKARIAELLTPGLDAVSGIVGLASVRLEYANQFRMNEDLDAHPLKDLFRDNSPWLSPNALNFKDMWHCHTGAMTQLDSDKKAVELVNIDRIDIPSSIGTAAVRRVLNILAGVEERTPPSPGSDKPDAPIDALAALPRLHDRVKNLLAEVLSDSMIEKIKLWRAAE